jgi:outer membrane protein assembly factor BamB
MPTPQTSLRIWPAVVIAGLLVLARYIIPAVVPDIDVFGVDAALFVVLGGMAGALATLVWWLFFSRARWSERVIAIGVMAVVILAIRPFTHISIQHGMMGMMYLVYAVPATLSLAFLTWAILGGRMSGWTRHAAMVVAIVIGCGVWMLARSNGIYGGIAELEWRWTPTAEDLLLARESDAPRSSRRRPHLRFRTRPPHLVHPAHPRHPPLA